MCASHVKSSLKVQEFGGGHPLNRLVRDSHGMNVRSLRLTETSSSVVFSQFTVKRLLLDHCTALVVACWSWLSAAVIQHASHSVQSYIYTFTGGKGWPQVIYLYKETRLDWTVCSEGHQPDSVLVRWLRWQRNEVNHLVMHSGTPALDSFCRRIEWSNTVECFTLVQEQDAEFWIEELPLTDPYCLGSASSETASVSHWHMKESMILAGTSVWEISLIYFWRRVGGLTLVKKADVGQVPESWNVSITQATTEDSKHTHTHTHTHYTPKHAYIYRPIYSVCVCITAYVCYSACVCEYP